MAQVVNLGGVSRQIPQQQVMQSQLAQALVAQGQRRPDFVPGSGLANAGASILGALLQNRALANEQARQKKLGQAITQFIMNPPKRPGPQRTKDLDLTPQTGEDRRGTLENPILPPGEGVRVPRQIQGFLDDTGLNIPPQMQMQGMEDPQNNTFGFGLIDVPSMQVIGQNNVSPEAQALAEQLSPQERFTGPVPQFTQPAIGDFLPTPPEMQLQQAQDFQQARAQRMAELLGSLQEAGVGPVEGISLAQQLQQFGQPPQPEFLGVEGGNILTRDPLTGEFEVQGLPVSRETKFKENAKDRRLAAQLNMDFTELQQEREQFKKTFGLDQKRFEANKDQFERKLKQDREIAEDRMENQQKVARLRNALVEITNQNESAAEKGLVEIGLNRYDKVLEAKSEARKANNALKVQKDMLKEMDTGPGTSVKKFAANVGAFLGIPGAQDFAGTMEQFQSITMSNLLERMKAQKGPQTEGDAERALNTLASIDNTRKGNEFILDYGIATNQMLIDKANFFDKVLVDEGPAAVARAEQLWEKHLEKENFSIWDMPSLQKWKKNFNVKEELSETDEEREKLDRIFGK